MTYVAADKYLQNRGRLGFVITRSVFQSELGGWHFRRFRLPNQTPLRVNAVNDFDSLKPFSGQAANVTSVLTLTRSEETQYPVPWISWRGLPGNPINEDTQYEDVLNITERLAWIAKPIDRHQIQSSWLFGEEKAIGVLLKLIRQSYYSTFAREGVNTRGANGVYFIDAQLFNSRLLIRNRVHDGDDSKVQVLEQIIESDFVFPLLRGKDVSRWNANPAGYILMPHSEHSPTSPTLFRDLPRKTQEFLVSFKAKLSSRKKFRNFDPAGTEWYGLYSVLNATFAPFKVVWREMAGGSIAAVVSQSTLPTGEMKIVVPDHKLFIIPCVSADEADFVCGIFNSSISSYLINSYAIATGISTHVLDRLPIPQFDVSDDLHRRISVLAANCRDAVQSGNQAEGIEKELNKCVAAALGLSTTEARAIEHALANI